jgi:hypothetical protein
MRPIGLSHHQMEGQIELTHSAMLFPQREAAGLIEQAAVKCASQYGKGSNDFGLF